MNQNTEFCCECREDVAYTITEEEREEILKGKLYRYMGKVAKCDKCGNEIHVGELRNFNLKALYNEYRNKNQIISLEEILQIPKKYAIGKRPLSLLLGWGEQTFTRYCEGDMPTKQYSDVLQNIYDNPEYYSEMLEKNKAILTVIAYRKSSHATNELIRLKLT